MAQLTTLTVPVRGMDCAECAQHVEHAIGSIPGVASVNVFLTSERANVRLDPALVDLPSIERAVESAGYSVPPEAAIQPPALPHQQFTRNVVSLLALVFGAVLFVVVVGEWLGLLEQLTERVPFLAGLALVVIGGWPIFRNVARAALKRQVTSHTLMTLGVVAALAVGQWATAAVVVFFMRVGGYVENFTADRARRAVKDLTALAPQTARVERDGDEIELPIGEVRVGDTLVVRHGEKIAADGEVIAGQATVDQATITGEAMPVEAGPGARVYAATIARLGSLRLRVVRVGADTTFGRAIKLVEEAEAHRANVQRFADRFTNYYLPVVAAIAALTFVIRRDPLATAAVLVVACACSIALATPIAMLASIGAGAKRGLLVKGGRYLESLARADTLLIDKTGTLTLGKPRVVDVVTANGGSRRNWNREDAKSAKKDDDRRDRGQDELLRLAASAERYSEHPLAEAVRQAARERGLAIAEPHEFESLPGLGMRARVNGEVVAVGSRRILAPAALPRWSDELEASGKTLLFVARNGEFAGAIAAADTIRAEVPAAVAALKALGVRRIELLTGDNEATASTVAATLGVPYRAGLLPEDKIAIVKEYQAQGRVVVMIGDGVNDAPALAQADVGLAMGTAGSDVAIEAAHVALMRDDWRLVPEVFRIARRTMGVVKMNLIFTAIYNIAGLSLAAFGLLPPSLAAAAQSLPDLGILANSSRLIRQR